MSIRTYTVKEGETLAGIAEAQEVSVKLLTALSRLANPSKIRAGDTLKIPVRAALPPDQESFATMLDAIARDKNPERRAEIKELLEIAEGLDFELLRQMLESYGLGEDIKRGVRAQLGQGGWTVAAFKLLSEYFSDLQKSG
jgi:LysM repeat protein